MLMAIAVALTVQLLWDNYVYDRYLSGSIRVFYRVCYLKILLMVLIFALVVTKVSVLIITEKIRISFITKIMVFVGFYLILVFILHNKEERQAATGLFSKKWKE